MILFCPRCGTQLAERVKGEWFESAEPCGACGLVLREPPLMLAEGPDEEEVEYDLDGWDVPERAAATAALAEVDIPYRWQEDLILVVPTVAEDEVDVLLEELEPPGDLEDDEAAGVDGAGGGGEGDEEDGGEAAQAAMSELFVVADRLQHTPDDVELGGSLVQLAGDVGESAPPYGIERPVWRRIQALAAATAIAFEDGGADEAVVAEARALRDFLRELV